MISLALSLAANVLAADPVDLESTTTEPFTPKFVMSVAPADMFMMMPALEMEGVLTGNSTVYAFCEASPIWQGAGFATGTRYYTQGPFEGLYLDAHVAVSQWNDVPDLNDEPFKKIVGGLQLGISHVAENRISFGAGGGIEVGSITHNHGQSMDSTVGDGLSLIPTARLQVGYAF